MVKKSESENQAIDRSAISTDASDETRVLILMNKNQDAHQIFDGLKKYHCQLHFVYDLLRSVEDIVQFEPDVILLSWGLKGIDVKKVFSILEAKSKALCVVFGVEATAKSNTTLSASGIPRIILPPLSSGGVYLKIQNLLKDKNAEKEEDTSLKSVRRKSVKVQWDDYEFSVVSSTKLKMGDAVFEIATRVDKIFSEKERWNLKRDAPITDDKIWHTTHEVEGKKKSFYFKGAEPEKIQSIVQEGIKVGKTPLIMSDKEATDQELQIFQNAKFTKEFEISQEALDKSNLEAALSQAIIAPEPQTKVFKSETSGEQNATKRQSQLEQCLIKALGKVLPQPPQGGGVTPIKMVTRLISIVVKSPLQNGFLIGALANDLPDYELAKKIHEELVQEMKIQGTDLEDICGVLEVHVEPFEMIRWAKDNAEFLSISQQGQNEFALMFLPTSEIPKFTDINFESLCSASMKYFIGGATLLFDIYLRLPKNDKFLLYLKKGTPFTEKTLQRLESFGVKDLYIKKSDQCLFFAYTAKALINSKP